MKEDDDNGRRRKEILIFDDKNCHKSAFSSIMICSRIFCFMVQ